MFTIRFTSTRHRPDQVVTLRTSVDGWDTDLPGAYADDAWRFDRDEARYPGGFACKFVLEQSVWMLGDNLMVPAPVAGAEISFGDEQVQFPEIDALIVENGQVQQRFFPPRLDEDHLFDAIVIGSGMGGGILADQLSDQGVDVLVLEAGSYLFPVHVANLPRQHQIGQFDKHVWGLYDEFEVTNYVNSPGSTYAGGQAFNLGGRSLFWGGFIPRMTWWELDHWPTPLRWHLEGHGYQRAEDLMNRIPVTPSPYHERVKTLLRNAFPAYALLDAPMAVQHATLTLGTIPNGMFSTADLLMESALTDDAAGRETLAVNLNHPVVRLETDGNQVTGVVAHDLIGRAYRTFRGKAVVLAAGTIESAKLAQLSNLSDPNGRIGVGLTDHPIYFTHFAIPANSPHFDAMGSSKLLLQYQGELAHQHPYNVLLELGADFNEARYVDDDILRRHLAERGNQMLCEVVFLFNAPLVDTNQVAQAGPAHVKPAVTMQPSPAADPYLAEIAAIKDQLMQLFQAVPLPGDTLDLDLARLGGVAHEVGTLRLAADGSGVVDLNLKFLAYDNLYACDLSVFPSSPAANPSLTLAALAIRLADHVKGVI